MDTPNNEIRQMIERLKANWRTLPAGDKAQRLREIVNRGISKRELAEELGLKSDASVRYYLNNYEPVPMPADFTKTPERGSEEQQTPTKMPPPIPQDISANEATEDPVLQEISITSKIEHLQNPAQPKHSDLPKRIRTVGMCSDEIVQEAISALKRFLVWEVRYSEGPGLQLLEEVQRRVMAAECFGSLPKPAAPDADPWVVVQQSAPKNRSDIEMENFVEQMALALCKLVPEPKAREYVLRVILNAFYPGMYPLPHKVPA